MKMGKFKKLLNATLIMTIFILGYGCGGTSTKSPEEMETEAFITAKSFMEIELKSPSTADFSNDYKFEYLGDSKMKIVSYVDAKNSFGAEIRTYYRITMIYNGGDWAELNNWTLDNLETE